MKQQWVRGVSCWCLCDGGAEIQVSMLSGVVFIEIIKERVEDNLWIIS
jgi:hypothetical protein